MLARNDGHSIIVQLMYYARDFTENEYFANMRYYSHKFKSIYSHYAHFLFILRYTVVSENSRIAANGTVKTKNIRPFVSKTVISGPHLLRNGLIAQLMKNTTGKEQYLFHQIRCRFCGNGRIT